jgi:TatA/E family protein of Tat protein translocase
MQLLFINISTSELVIVFLVVLLLFGPRKLPEIVRFLGKLFNDIKRAGDEVKREITQSTAGISEELKKTGEQIRKEVEATGNQVMEAIPRPSIRHFEKAGDDDIPPRPQPQTTPLENNSGGQPSV